MGEGGSVRRWLVFAYFTGVDGMAASLHVDRVVEEMRRRGMECLVVTGAVAPPHRAGAVRVPCLAPSGIRFELRHRFKRSHHPLSRGLLKPLAMLGLSPFYLLEKVLFPAETAWSWSLPAAAAGRRLARRFEPQVLLSTCGPYSAHLAAAAVARDTGLPWIAEFRDPLRHEGAARGALEELVLARVERTVAQEAAGAVYFVEQARANASARERFRGRTAVIYPGAPPRSGPPPAWMRGPSLRFLHFGTLSRTRNLGAVVEALRLLRARSSPALAEIEVCQVGFSDRGVRAQASAFPDRIRILERVPQKEADRLMAAADVLLLIQDDDEFSAETIPSKAYEYLQSGRPVLGLVHRNPELSGILVSLGHRAVELSDPSALAAAMEDLHRAWRAEGLPSRAQASPHTVAAAVDGLCALAEEVAGRARP